MTPVLPRMVNLQYFETALLPGGEVNIRIINIKLLIISKKVIRLVLIT